MEEKNSKMLAEQQAEESDEGEIDLWSTWIDGCNYVIFATVKRILHRFDEGC